MQLLLLRYRERGRRRRFHGDVPASGIAAEIGREDVVPIREIEVEGLAAAAAAAGG